MTQPANSSIGSIRRRILIPIVSALLALLIINSLIENKIHGSIQEDRILKSTDGVKKGFSRLLNDSADSMTGLIRIVDKSIELQSAWLNNDRYLLNRLAVPVYESLKQQFNITHFYFHNIDGTNFLRVHKPDLHGDQIERRSFQIAMQKQYIGVGLEVGVNGDLVLRVVHPWKIAGKLQGYIEIGREIDKITLELGKISKTNLITLIDKQYVNRDQYLNNSRYQTGWNKYEKYLLNNEPEGSLEATLLTNEVITKISSPGQTLRIPHEGKTFLASSTPIIDINNNQAGLLLLLDDITSEVGSEKLLYISKIITGIIIGIILFIIFYIYIGKIQKELNATHSNLLNEIHIHKQTEKELINKTEELINRNQELELYSYSIAHDLRAPLRGIVGFSQIVLEDNLAEVNEDTQRHLNRIIDSGKHMSLIIDEILELSRIAHCDINIVDLNISDVAKKIIKSKLKAEQYKYADYQIQENLVVQADPRLIQILLTQLIGNALKYSQYKDEPYVELGQTEIDGKRIFFIKDNGVGFDMQYCDKIFSAFQQLHGDEFDGTGIGLAMVQRILKRHGEKIWVESVLGEGTTFYFTLKPA